MNNALWRESKVKEIEEYILKECGSLSWWWLSKKWKGIKASQMAFMIMDIVTDFYRVDRFPPKEIVDIREYQCQYEMFLKFNDQKEYDRVLEGFQTQTPIALPYVGPHMFRVYAFETPMGKKDNRLMVHLVVRDDRVTK